MQWVKCKFDTEEFMSNSGFYKLFGFISKLCFSNKTFILIKTYPL